MEEIKMNNGLNIKGISYLNVGGNDQVSPHLARQFTPEYIIQLKEGWDERSHAPIRRDLQGFLEEILGFREKPSIELRQEEHSIGRAYVPYANENPIPLGLYLQDGNPPRLTLKAFCHTQPRGGLINPTPEEILQVYAARAIADKYIARIAQMTDLNVKESRKSSNRRKLK